MAKIKLGDIFEIETSRGRAYLHYIYLRQNGMELVRVLQGLYPDGASSLESVADMQEQFMVFFPVAAAARKGIIRRVGNFPVDCFDKPKYMRTLHSVKGQFLGWHIVDTDTLHHQLVKQLTPAQMKLSPWGIWNDTLLVKRLTEGWSLEKWV